MSEREKTFGQLAFESWWRYTSSDEQPDDALLASWWELIDEDQKAAWEVAGNTVAVTTRRRMVEAGT